MTRTGTQLAMRLLIVAVFSATICVSVRTPAQDTEQEKKATAPQRAQPAFAQVEEQAGLPRVLLIGDSISMGYTIPVRKLLDGKANVLRPSMNCGPSSRGVASIDGWLGTGKWDVIHFNFGLHDIVFYSADGSKRAEPNEVGARHQVLAEDYEKNLRTLVARLKKTGAEVVWCSTTPVPEGAGGRVADEATQYNEIAERVMKESGIAINDLHAFALPNLKDIQQPKNVHFTPEGSAALAKQVAKAIEDALGRRQAQAK
jgi:acyl-CoA thioesterase-1